MLYGRASQDCGALRSAPAPVCLRCSSTAYLISTFKYPRTLCCTCCWQRSSRASARLPDTVKQPQLAWRTPEGKRFRLSAAGVFTMRSETAKAPSYFLRLFTLFIMAAVLAAGSARGRAQEATNRPEKSQQPADTSPKSRATDVLVSPDEDYK